MDYGKCTILIEAIMYTNEDVDMFVKDKHTALSISACNEEYLHVHTQDNDDYDEMGMLLSKEHAELLRDTLDVFLYTDEYVDMSVQYEYTELITYAWDKEYLHVHTQDDSSEMGILLSKEQAELLRDTLDVVLAGGYAYE